MKGIVIQHPFEVRVVIEGDSFHQGEALRCRLVMKNHTSTTQPPDNQAPVRPRLELAVANLKRLKQREPDPFTEIITAPIPEMLVAPGAEQEFQWSFLLADNCAISDKSQSLILLYGIGEGALPGQLLIPVKPSSYMQRIIESVESSFQFVLRDITSNGGWVVARFKASSAKEFSLVEELALKLQQQGGNISVQYDFKVKRFDSESGALGVKRAKSVVHQVWSPADYLLPGEHLNYEGVESRLREGLGSVTTGL